MLTDQHTQCVLIEVKSLIDAELYDSAENLASLYMSAVRPTGSAAHDFNAALGDALFGKKEYKRAFNHFQQAEQLGKGAKAALCASDAKLRLKQAKCMAALRDHASALKCMESIPAKLRDLSMHRLMGRLYEESNLKRLAVQCYKDALLISPLSLELIGHVIGLGMGAEEVLQTLGEAAERRQCSELAQVLKQTWLVDLVHSYAHKKNGDNHRAAALLRDLNASFPRNIFLLAQTAHISGKMLGHDADTLMVYRHIHKLDKYYVHHMDHFAMLLHTKGTEAELNKLASNLLEAAPSLAQPWIVAAWYCVSKGDLENALSLVDKAIVLQPQCSPAYLSKGRMNILANNFDIALIAFSQANSIEKDLPSFIGMIEANIALNKLKEAINWSRECISLFPKAAEGYFMMGNVLAKADNAPQEMIKAYVRALRHQPKYEAAATALSALLLKQNRMDDAVACLTDILQKVSSPALRLQLAKTYSSVQRYQDALEQLRISASLHGDDIETSKELERVEGLLRQETMDGFGADFDQDGIAEESFMDEDDDDGGGANRSLSFDE